MRRRSPLAGCARLACTTGRADSAWKSRNDANTSATADRATSPLSRAEALREGQRKIHEHIAAQRAPSPPSPPRGDPTQVQVHGRDEEDAETLHDLEADIGTFLMGGQGSTAGAEVRGAKGRRKGSRGDAAAAAAALELASGDSARHGARKAPPTTPTSRPNTKRKLFFVTWPSGMPGGMLGLRGGGVQEGHGPRGQGDKLSAEGITWDDAADHLDLVEKVWVMGEGADMGKGGVIGCDEGVDIRVSGVSCVFNR